MRFWLIEDKVGSVVGCELTRREAHETAAAFGVAIEEFIVSPLDVDVTADNVRRLLGGLGGYAKP
jgi:hypothetical protein